MRFIHTADWHLGNRMHNVDRKKEFDDFLLWIKEQLNSTKAETLIVAGDIYDTAMPARDVQTQFYRFLASLLTTCCKNVIIVGGNHDSGALLDISKDILSALNIHIIGSIANIGPENMVFELFDKDDNAAGICAAVPYVHENELRKYCNEEVEKGTFGDYAFKALYQQVYDCADKLRAGRNIPIIATGHLYAANLEGRYSETDDEIEIEDGKRKIDVIGTLGSVHVGSFPEAFDYVALGHIHYPTMVAKNPKVRYSGSPFILGFDEHNIKHSISLVEIGEKKELTVQKIEVPRTVDYLRITGDSKKIRETINEFIKNPPEKETNIELYYDWEEGFDVNQFVENLSNELPENVAIVHKKRNQEQEVSGRRNVKLDELELEDITFEDIFKGLIMENCPIDKTNLSEKEIEEKENVLINKFLPDLLESVADYNRGIRYEDK